MPRPPLRRPLPRGRRPGRPPLAVEPLEDRTVPSTVFLGPLRFDGDFTTSGNNQVATGTTAVGFAPAGEPFRQLAQFTGTVAVPTDPNAPAFTVTAAQLVSVAQPSPPQLDLWQTAGTFAFPVAGLTGGGVALTGGEVVPVSEVNFTPGNIRFTNPGGGSTADSLIQLQGGLQLPGLAGLTVPVGGGDFVTLSGAGVVLDDLSAAVAATVTVFGLSMAPTDLVVSYSGDDQTFTLGGGVKLSTADGGLSGVAAGLGTTDDPGLTYQFGAVQSAQFSIADTFAVFGLSLTPDDPLTLQLVAGNQFAGYGPLDTTLPAPLYGQLDGSLGTADQPGLVIGPAGVQAVAVTASGSLTVLGLVIQVGSAAVTLAGPNDFELTGQLTVPELFFATVTLPAGSGIHIRNGTPAIDGITLEFEDIPLGAFILDDMTVGFSDQNGTVDITAGAKVFFPGEFTLGASITLEDGTLDDISIAYTAAGDDGGIEIGDTGVFITGFAGSLQNLDHPKDLLVSAGVTLTYGGQYTFSGDSGSTTVTLLKAVGSVTIDRHMLSLSAAVYLGAITSGNTITGVLGSGSGSATLDWGKHDYRFALDATIFYGVFHGHLELNIAENGDAVGGLGSIGVAVPSAVPLIGGKDIASANFAFLYRKGDPLDSLVAAWVEINALVAKFDAGFEYNFGNKDIKFISNKQVDAIENGINNLGPQQFQYFATFTTPADATFGTLTATWNPAGGSQTVAVLPAGYGAGVPIDQSDFSAANGLTLATPLNGSGTVSVHAVGQTGNPNVPLPASSYQLIVTSNVPLDPAPTFTSTFGYTPPSITLGAVPPELTVSPVPIPVQAAAVENSLAVGTTATLYIDTDAQGYDGKVGPGASKVPFTYDPGWTLPLQLGGLLPRPYYLYAVIDDGFNKPTRSAYVGPFTPAPPISGTVSDPIHTVGVPGARVYLDLDADGRFDPGADPSTVTDAGGVYVFWGIAAGDYTVSVIVPPGYQLHPGTPGSRSVSFSGRPNPDTDFQLDEFASISGTVYADLNQDDVFAPGEEALSGWTVFLDDNGNDRLDDGERHARTNTLGQYTFYNLDPNTTYAVGRVLRPDYYDPGDVIGRTVLIGPDRFQRVTGQDFGVLPFFTAAGAVTDAVNVPVVAVNAGGGADGGFAGDAGFSGGATFYNSAAIDTSGVVDPAPQYIYQTLRYGTGFGYTVPGLAPNQRYTVRLHFADNYYNAVGQRLFDVAVNRDTVLQDYDIVLASGGVNAAVTEDLTATADETGTLAVTFTATKDQALVCGIEVFAARSPLGGWTVNLAPGRAEVAVNAGGGAAGPFAADAGFTGGQPAPVFPLVVNTSLADNPAPQAVYQTNRFDRDFSYALAGLVPNAPYTVRLHFAETYWDGPGDRVFDVAVNGQYVLRQFDIFRAAGQAANNPAIGKGIAVVREFAATADATGTVTLRFVSTNPGGTDNAQINGIELFEAAAGVAYNAGGGASGPYAADPGAVSGPTQTASTAAAIDTSAVAAPAPQAVYQTNRYGQDFIYILDGLTPGADYTVRLHFAETYWTAPRMRLFDVAINGATVLSDYDIFAEAGGPNVAVAAAFPAAAGTDGRIILEFTADRDNAQINGIEVLGAARAVTTDAAGNYAFVGLRAGEYAVTQQMPVGWRQVRPFRPGLQLETPAGGKVLAAGGDPNSVVTADFDGDGGLDIAVLDGSGSGRVVIYPNEDFDNPTVYQLNSIGSPTQLVAGNFLGSGRPDLAWVDGSGDVSLLQNLGPGQGFALKPHFWLIPVAVGSTGLAYSMVKGVFLAGGTTDQLAVRFDVGQGSVYLATLYVDLSGQPGSTVQSFFPAVYGAQPPWPVAVGRLFPGDPLDAALVGVAGQSPLLGYVPNAATLQPLAALPGGGMTVAGDINADGRLDFGLFDDRGNFFYAVQDGLGNFTGSASKVSSPQAGIDAAALRDVDGDLLPDLVWLTSGQPNPVNVVLNTGDAGAWFTPLGQSAWPLAAGTQGPLSLAVGDLDGDGLNDLVVADAGTGNVQVVVNLSVTAPTPITARFPLPRLAAADPLTTRAGNDFVNVRLGQINGTVFEDAARSGRYSPAKPGRPGDAVYLDLNRNGAYDPGEPRTAAGPDGTFAFDGLADGTYRVGAVPEAGRRTTGPAGGFAEVTVAGGRPGSPDVHFGSAARLFVPVADQRIVAGNRATAVVPVTGEAAARRVVFTLGPDAPPGAAIDPRTGVFTWRPPAALPPGEYPVTVRVHDPAEPSFAEEAVLTVRVEPRPPGAVAAGAGPEVRVFAADGTRRSAVAPYGPAFAGGVNAAFGDVTGDGVADLVTAPAGGGGPHVKVFDGLTGREVRGFFAFDPAFAGGVFLAAGDVNGDGYADIVTGAGDGGAPHVKVFDGKTGAELRSFFAYDPVFRGGARVATGDVDGDGYADIVTGAGAGGAPHVKVFDGSGGGELRSFFAYEVGFAGGVFVGAWDLDDDGRADVVTGTGPGGGPHVKAFAPDGGVSVSFLAYDPAFGGGVRVAAADLDGDGTPEVVTGAGPGGGPQVGVFDGRTGAAVRGFFAADPDSRGGIEVAAGGDLTL